MVWDFGTFDDFYVVVEEKEYKETASFLQSVADSEAILFFWFGRG